MVAMLRIVLDCFLYHKQDLAYPAKFESGILAAKISLGRFLSF